MPMQLGGREGGFALAVGGLSLSGAYGVYTALITRVRELFLDRDRLSAYEDW